MELWMIPMSFLIGLGVGFLWSIYVVLKKIKEILEHWE